MERRYTTDSIPVAFYVVTGTTTVPVGYLSPPLVPPSVCPGCGRCKDCGQSFAAPVPPLPTYPVWPAVGDPVVPSIICGTVLS